ncbi:hypothetical protein BH10ACI4_BH10ACI4_16420 [soil metagenome]
MNILTRSLASLLPLLVLLPALAQTDEPATHAQIANPAPTSYKITGTVISSSTGAAVPHCRIVPTRIDRSGATPRRSISPQDGVDTDERGHFSLSLPSSGSWALLARAPGFRPQGFDQHEGFSSSVVLTDQAPAFELIFRLVPDSVITGTIRDEANEAVRRAQVQVFAVPRGGVDGERASVNRGSASTDDRGHYEVGGLAPGEYRVTVQAQPWYATAAPSSRNQGGGAQLDPSLDVVYPMTWYPGVADGNAADTISLHNGETRQADMQLLPMPAFHLRIPIPQPESTGPDSGRRSLRYPQITSASPNNFFSPSSTTNAQGQLEVSGLAPGIYRIQTPDETGQPGRSTLVEIHANSPHTLDLVSAANTATVDIKIDGGPGTESLPLAFVDISNERNVFRSVPNRDEGGGTFRRGTAQRNAVTQQTASSEKAGRTIDLPPGRYSIFQSGSANFFLAGLSQGAKEIVGRVVTIPSGTSSLTLHIATGPATVNGIATLGGKPAVGAVVLLVPITVGELGSIAEPRRDQTNTDGSFDLDMVIPGQYILIAVDHGWDIRWNDPATLNHYLLRGIPLDLRTPSVVKQNIEAQKP